ncbi:hypothetical protein EC988_001473 [Linderina pennispora]|nr:hypothetical protein EC988_001473 [Linderina pennispora]
MQLSTAPGMPETQLSVYAQMARMAHLTAFHTGLNGDVTLPTMPPSLMTPLVPLFNRRISSSSAAPHLMSPPASGITPALQDGVMFSDIPFAFSPIISAEATNPVLVPPVSPTAVAFTRRRRNAILVSRPAGAHRPCSLEKKKMKRLSPSPSPPSSPLSGQRQMHREHSRSPGPYEYGRIGSRVYTQEVSNVLNEWLDAHKDDPYPSAEAKRQLMRETGLTKMQLKNWFCNVRRRKLSGAIKRSRSTKKTTQ